MNWHYNKKKATTGALIIFITIFVCSGAFLAINFVQKSHQEEKLGELSQKFDQIAEKEELSAEEEKSNFYMELKAKNEDFWGWIYIEDTPINYPVMYTPNDLEYYLRRNFEKKYSVYGIPFMDNRCDGDIENNDNVILYGHYVDNGTMFGSLEKYKDKDYLNEHNMISFDTLSETKNYEILSVFVTQDSKKGFPYYEFIKAESEEEYNRYVKKITALSLHKTGVEATYGRQLLTLSTCDYGVKNGRLVVIAVEASAAKPELETE